MEEITSILDLEKGANSYWWIGGRKVNSKWQWLSKDFGTFLMSYTNWAQNEPNNIGGAEECVHLQGFTELRWNDSVCSNKLAYICERVHESKDVIG